RNPDLREMPTHLTRFSEPTPDPRANPFDYFQYSLLPLGTPVLIAHTSADGRWHFVECPIAGGWVDAEDLALVDDSFIALYRNASFAAVVHDNVRLTSQNGASAATGDQRVSIGTILPALAGGSLGTSIMPGGANAQPVTLLAPVKDSRGMARTAPFAVSSSDVVARPLPLTPGNVATVGNVMMGQLYGWGGMFGERDCSALTRDLLTPFGIWLPRNSVAQARTGAVNSLEGMTPKEKEDTIMRNGVPFLSLVGMRGHIMLYVGKYNNRPAIFHNVWGVRTVEGNDDNARLVIGRAVVTSVTPGKELKNLYRGTTFVDRLRTLSTPADTLQ
ncbi:MAG: SH3 domain-containing protein, partial [Desulfovibrio sp.]|nr:SH3 domain-containing protein [Desulfovibrio sp.]